MDLYQEVQRAATDAQVIEAVRRWIEIEFAGADSRSRLEQHIQLIALTAGHDSHWRAELIEAAKSNPNIWEGLRRYALQQTKDGHPIEPGLTELLRSEPPKRGRGKGGGRRSPYVESIGMIYARAVWCVYHAGAGRYTLESAGKGLNNAFALVEQAAKPITGATFNQVRNACKGQLDRLTQIYRHAEKNYLNWHPGIATQRKGK